MTARRGQARALERAGLLRLRETRPNRGTVEKWYESVAQRLEYSGRARTPRRAAGESSRPRGSVALAVIEQARREPSSERRPLVVRLRAVGSPARIARISRRLRSLLDDLERECAGNRSTTARRRRADLAHPAREPAQDPAQERWALTLTFAPTGPGTSSTNS